MFGASIMQDKDLGMYNPAESRTSRHLSCSHELCDLGANCKSPKQPCPYIVNYYSENTSSSGLLVEDTVYLATSGEHTSVQAPVIIGYVQAYWNLMLDCKIFYSLHLFHDTAIIVSLIVRFLFRFCRVLNAAVVGGRVVVI